MVLCGCGHLSGPTGVLALLEQHGWRAKPIYFTFPTVETAGREFGSRHRALRPDYHHDPGVLGRDEVAASVPLLKRTASAGSVLTAGDRLSWCDSDGAADGGCGVRREEAQRLWRETASDGRAWRRSGVA